MEISNILDLRNKTLDNQESVPKRTPSLRKNIFGMTAVLLVVSMNIIGLLSVGETAAYYWDIEVSGGNFLGAARLDFVVESETEGGFRTQSQGGWGAKANGNNPASYRDANFDGAFPDGVTIGHLDGFIARFTTSAAVEKFLPAGGSSGQFNQSYLNPASTTGGNLAGQTLALALSIGFDDYDSEFGASPWALADWVIEGSLISACDGLTAGELLDESNKLLSGGSSSLINIPQAASCLNYVNLKFDNGIPYVIKATLSEALEGIDWKYRVRFEKTGGSDDFCADIGLEALLDNAEVYDGSLAAFVSPTQTFTPAGDDWEFLIDIPSATDSEFCRFNLVYEGWQENLALFPFGFHDIETVSNLAGSYPIVINEFLPNPIGADDASMPDGEWVELYNLSGQDFDVAGWYLYDNNDSQPLEITAGNSDNNGNLADGGETVVPASGYLVVYLNGDYSDWLDNVGDDKVRLYDGLVEVGNLVDSYSFNGAPENKSFARIPDGTGDFVDPIPTPLKPNIVDETVEPDLAVEPVFELPVVEAEVIFNEIIAEQIASDGEQLLISEPIDEAVIIASEVVVGFDEIIVPDVASSSVSESESLPVEENIETASPELTGIEPAEPLAEEQFVDFSKFITVDAPLPKETEVISETTPEEQGSLGE